MISVRACTGILAALLATGCSSDTYALWGTYHETEKRIYDGDRSEATVAANTRAFKVLFARGEIVQLNWSKELDAPMQEAMRNEGIREMRHGLVLVGGPWPIAIGATVVYLYKHDAGILEPIGLKLRQTPDRSQSQR